MSAHACRMLTINMSDSDQNVQTAVQLLQGENRKSEIEGVTALLSKFYSDSVKQPTDWSMKCRLCGTRTHSKPGVTSNFHRHVRV